MKLVEHPDFEQAVIRAAEHFRARGLRESIIEKDSFVTEALRTLEQGAGKLIIFKGGTSPSPRSPVAPDGFPRIGETLLHER
jgi:hypothetical protein